MEDQPSDIGPLLDLKIEGFSGTYRKITASYIGSIQKSDA